MHTTNYQHTLILPSPDCAADVATVPTKPGTVAVMQYERLTASPYACSSDDLIFGIHADRQEIEPADRPQAREAFFSKGQACLRASPLVKSYGWAIHHDAQGKVGLVDPGDPLCDGLVARQDVTKLHGMRSKRS